MSAVFSLIPKRSHKGLDMEMLFLYVLGIGGIILAAVSELFLCCCIFVVFYISNFL